MDLGASNSGESTSFGGMIEGYLTAFPDLHMSVEQRVVEGNLISTRWNVTGTHDGPLGDIEPTGKKIDIAGQLTMRFEGHEDRRGVGGLRRGGDAQADRSVSGVGRAGSYTEPSGVHALGGSRAQEVAVLFVNRLRKLSERFIRPVVPVAAALALAIAATACTLGPAPTGDIISGVVQGQDGPEAGVWVIAATDALGTGFAKIVVTDEDGRFVLPELPEASYDVWVRGYGLADSEPVAAAPGDDLVLTAVYPETPQEQAAVYPASHWYSLLEGPARQ